MPQSAKRNRKRAPKQVEKVIRDKQKKQHFASGILKQDVLFSFLILLAVFASFQPCLDNEFVDWDDFQCIRDNSRIRSLAPSNILWMLTTGHMAQWQPAGWFAWAVQYQILNGGSATSFSRGIHLVTVLLHAAVSILLFFTAKRLLLAAFSRNGEPYYLLAGFSSFAGGLLFAVHPLQVETVGWATAQPYIFSMAAALLALHFYLKKIETDRIKYYFFSLGFFLLSVLFKPIAVAIPFVLLVIDRYVLGRLTGFRSDYKKGNIKITAEKVPYAVIALAASLIAALVKQGAGSQIGFEVHGPLQRLAQACYGMLFYAWKTVIPLNLSPIYELKLPINLSEPKYILSAGFIFLLFVFLFSWGKKFHAVKAAVFSYTLFLAPVMGFLQSGNQETADRYAYLPCSAWYVLIAAGIYKSAARTADPKKAVRSVAPLLVIFVVILGFLSRKQCDVWQNTASLWTHAVRMQKESSLAQNGYGYVLLQKGDAAQAVKHFRFAIRLKHDNDLAHQNLWTALRRLNRTNELINAYKETVRYIPDMKEAYYNLGNVRFQRKEYEKALENYREALKIDPDYALAHGSLSGVLYSSGNYREAIEHGRKAVALNPSLGAARRNLALALKASGRLREAREELEKALQMNPDDERALRLLQSWFGVVE